MARPSLRVHTDAVLAALEAQGLTVGDADAKGLSGKFCVVYRIPGGESSGPLDAPNDDAELIYQVTCVGDTREQAEWVEDKVMNLLDGITVEGRSISRVDLDSYDGIRRDDALPLPRFYATPRFRIYSTP